MAKKVSSKSAATKRPAKKTGAKSATGTPSKKAAGSTKRTKATRAGEGGKAGAGAAPMTGKKTTKKTTKKSTAKSGVKSAAKPAVKKTEAKKPAAKKVAAKKVSKSKETTRKATTKKVARSSSAKSSSAKTGKKSAGAPAVKKAGKAAATSKPEAKKPTKKAAEATGKKSKVSSSADKKAGAKAGTQVAAEAPEVKAKGGGPESGVSSLPSGLAKRTGAKPKSAAETMRSETAAAKKAADKAAAKGDDAGDQVDPESTRFRSMYATNIEASQAAAAKFAASAGLDPSMVAMAEQEQVVEKGPRLTKSPFGKRDLAKYREMLVAKREELLADMVALEEEALTGGGSGSLSTLPQHMADQGSDNWEQTMALGLVASQREHVKEVDAAIARIDNGTFGVCEETGQAINRERLDEAPWARLSIEAARERERLGYRR